MASQFWIQHDGNVSGPFAQQQLQQFYANGMLQPNDLVSADQQQWSPAGQFFSGQAGQAPGAAPAGPGQPVPTAAGGGSGTKSKSMLPLILAIAAVVAVAGVLTVVFMGGGEDGPTSSASSSSDPRAARPRDPGDRPARPARGKTESAPEQLSANLDGDADQQVYPYSPPDAAGVVHIDGARSRPLLEIVPLLPPQLAALLPISRAPDRVKACQFYMLKGEDRFSVLVASGSMSSESQFRHEFFAHKPNSRSDRTSRRGWYHANSPLVPGEKTQIVFGRYTSDVPKEVVVAGPNSVISPEYIEKREKGKLGHLDKLLKQVDSSAAVWGVADLSKSQLEADSPRYMLFQFHLDGKNTSSMVLGYRRKELAAAVVQAIQASPYADLFQVKLDGAEVILLATLNAKTLDEIKPKLRAARRESLKPLAAARLQNIGRAILFFQAQFDDRPTDTDTLLDITRLDRQDLTSPATDIRRDKDGEPIAPPVNIAYAYTPLNAPAETIMAAESPAIYADDGAHVLTSDFTVRWMDKKDLDSALARDESFRKSRGLQTLIFPAVEEPKTEEGPGDGEVDDIPEGVRERMGDEEEEIDYRRRP